MSNQPKAHHKVPRFYLDGFRTDGSGSGKKARIWVYRRNQDTCRKARPSQTAFENDFYTYFHPDGSRDPEIETWLANQVDSPASVVWPKLSDANYRLSEDDREVVAVFAAVLFTRTDHIRQTFEALKGKALEMAEMMKAAHEARPDLTEARQQIFASGPGKSYPIEDLLQIGHNDYVRLVPEHVPKIAETLAAMHWTLFDALPPNHFVTSDNPVSRHNPFVHEFRAADLEIEGIEVALPISRTCCLVMSYHGFEGRCSADRNTVQLLNQRTIDWSESEVYSSQDEAWLSDQILTKPTS